MRDTAAPTLYPRKLLALTACASVLLIAAISASSAVAHSGIGRALEPRLGTVSVQFGTKGWRQLHGRCTSTTFVKGQGRSCRDTSGMWRVETGRGSVLTHGPDQSADTLLAAATADNAVATVMSSAATADAVTCTSAGNQHTQLIYARPPAAENRLAAISDGFKAAVYEGSAFLNAQSQARDAERNTKLKVACDGGGDASIIVLELNHSAATDSFATIAQDIREQGYNSLTTRYLVYYDGSVGAGIAGQGEMYLDDRKGVDSFNNLGGLIAVQYGGVTGAPDWFTLLHEAGHNMGAVQSSSPNSSQAGHCNDGTDVMCYADGGAGQVADPYSAGVCATIVFDCGHDDYFDPAPEVGSYLANYWNVAGTYNTYLDRSLVAVEGGGGEQDPPAEPDLTAPTIPGNVVAASTGVSSIGLTWTPVVDGDSLMYYVYKNLGGEWVNVGATSGESYTVSSLTPNTEYQLAVTAKDTALNESEQQIISAQTAADTSAPTRPSNFQRLKRTRTSLYLGWSASTDNVGVYRYRVYVRTATGWKPVQNSTSRRLSKSGLKPGRKYSFLVKAYDRAGNSSYLSRRLDVVTLS